MHYTSVHEENYPASVRGGRGPLHFQAEGRDRTINFRVGNRLCASIEQTSPQSSAHSLVVRIVGNSASASRQASSSLGAPVD